jgi:carbonic anhydrase
MTFLGVPKLSAKLADVPTGSQVCVKLDVDFMDHASIETLRSFRASHEKAGGRVVMDNAHGLL